MTRRELHEKISETLGLKKAGTIGTFDWLPTNYDADEAANAMLLEAMPWPKAFRDEPTKLWTIGFDFGYAQNADRKIAIVDAYAKWKNLT